jgi:hypothetical protein
MLDDARRDAHERGDLEAEARATHDLAVTAGKRNEYTEAVVYAFQAYQLYEHHQHKMRALADLGVSLQSLGHYGAASDAFEIVLGGEIPNSMRIAATLELIQLATLTSNRMMFEKHRREIQALKVDLPPTALVDFEIKLGVGFAEFGKLEVGKKHLQRAVTHAEEYGLNDLLFRAEAALDEIAQLQKASETVTAITAPEEFVPDVVSVARELRELRVATV